MKNNSFKKGCGELLQGKFSKGGMEIDGNAESILRKCSKVIYYSEIQKRKVSESNDYAVIKLNNSTQGISYFNFKRSGISENELLEIHVMSHDVRNNGPYKKIKSDYDRKFCMAQSSDVLGVIKSNGSSPLAFFSRLKKDGGNDCQAIKGNSGSPILNEKGALVGIVHGGLMVDFRRVIPQGVDARNCRTIWA